jgi:hypothetical protein
VIFSDFRAFGVRLAGRVRFERSDDFKLDVDVVCYRGPDAGGRGHNRSHRCSETLRLGVGGGDPAVALTSPD